LAILATVDLDGASKREVEIPAFAGMTIKAGN